MNSHLRRRWRAGLAVAFLSGLAGYASAQAHQVRTPPQTTAPQGSTEEHTEAAPTTPSDTTAQGEAPPKETTAQDAPSAESQPGGTRTEVEETQNAAEQPTADEAPSSQVKASASVSASVGKQPPAQDADPSATPGEDPRLPHQGSDDYAGASDKGLVAKPPPPSKMNFDVMLDLTIPFGETQKVVSRIGLQGFAVAFRYYIRGGLAVGAGASFDGLSQKSSGTIDYDDLTITSTHTQQLSFTTLLAKAYYAFRRKDPQKEKLEPYVALGAGAALSAQRLVTGYSTLTNNQWHFAVVPEVGTQLDLGQIVLMGAARVNYLPAAGGSPTHTFANISLGVSIQ